MRKDYRGRVPKVSCEGIVGAFGSGIRRPVATCSGLLRYTEAYETNHRKAGDGGVCVTGEASGLDRTSAVGTSDRADCMRD